MRLLRCQMEKLQAPIVHREMHLEHALPLNEDNELLNYGEITCVNAQDRIQDGQTETQCSGAENTCLEPEALALMQSAQAFVCSLHPQLQCEEYGLNAVSGGPAGAITPDIDIRPPSSDMNPVHTPHANPPWPALAPHANPVAAVPHRNQFWPTYTPPQHFNPAFNLNLEFNLDSVFNLDPGFNLNPEFNLNPGFNLNPAFNLNPGFNCNPGFNLNPAFILNPGFNCNPGFNLNPAFDLNPGFNCNPGFNLNPAFNLNPGFNCNPEFNLTPAFNCNPGFNFNPAFNPLVACGDSALSCLVLRPHMSVCPAPYPHLNTTGSVSNTHSHSHTQSFPLDMLDSYELWQRLCKTAEDYSSSSPDTEALACFFIDVFRCQAVHSPDLPFSHAVHTAVAQWRKIPPFQRKQYHVTAKMFINLKKLNQRANRADGDQSIPTGNVKKKSKPAKKARPVEDLAESALAEYSQVMDALGSKVSDGSEVTAANEEDVCAQFINQLFNHCESTNEAGFDMDYISSLLSTDHNLTDVLKENCQDLFSSSIPKPVAGCSNWTPQRDFSQYNGSHLQDHMMQKPFRINTPTGMENGGQNAFQSSQGIQVHETIHSAFQDFGPAGNSSGGKGETLFVAELETTVQSECFSLQNYKSHHASFTHSIKRPKNPANGGVEHDGEKNTLARQKTEKMGSTKEKRNKNTDIPLDSQQGMRNSRAKTQTRVKETPEKKNVNRNKKQKRQRRRRKQEKITALDERTTDDKRKTAENQRNRNTQAGQRKSATKNGAKETDLFKITTERAELRQRTDVTEARKVRRDDEIKRRQRPIKKRADLIKRVDKKHKQKETMEKSGKNGPLVRMEMVFRSGRGGTQPKPTQTTNDKA